MAYRFRLDALLRLQRSLETQQEQRLLATLGAVRSIESRIEALDANRCLRKREVLSHIETDGTVAELHFLLVVEHLAAKKRNELLGELTRAEERRKVQTELYREAHRNTEILASLDAEQRNEYNAVLARRDQQLSDELFLMRKRFEAGD